MHVVQPSSPSASSWTSYAVDPDYSLWSSVGPCAQCHSAKDIGHVPTNPEMAIWIQNKQENARRGAQVMLYSAMAAPEINLLWNSLRVAYAYYTFKPSTQPIDVGNAVHYDQLNGGVSAGGPTQLQQRYPSTQFQFARRGQAGVDVTYVRGTHPSAYPNSNWPAEFNYGDFKPNTLSGAKTFYRELSSGKFPIDTIPLPYDPQTRALLLDYFFGP